MPPETDASRRTDAIVRTVAIEPGKLFDVVLSLDQVAEAYRAMDERPAIKVMLQPCNHFHLPWVRTRECRSGKIWWQGPRVALSMSTLGSWALAAKTWRS